MSCFRQHDADRLRQCGRGRVFCVPNVHKDIQFQDYEQYMRLLACTCFETAPKVADRTSKMTPRNHRLSEPPAGHGSATQHLLPAPPKSLAPQTAGQLPASSRTAPGAQCRSCGASVHGRWLAAGDGQQTSGSSSSSSSESAGRGRDGRECRHPERSGNRPAVMAIPSGGADASVVAVRCRAWLSSCLPQNYVLWPLLRAVSMRRPLVPLAMLLAMSDFGPSMSQTDGASMLSRTRPSRLR